MPDITVKTTDLISPIWTHILSRYWACFQFEGLKTKDVKVSFCDDADTDDDAVSVCADAIQKEIEDQKSLDWTNDDICVILASFSEYSCRFLLLLFLEIKRRDGDIQIYFENETLSQEWPVVINCCKFDL